MSCRVCKSHLIQKGLFYRCSSPECGAAHWDKYTVKKLVKSDKSAKRFKEPSWMSTLLEEAEIPESKSGEYYVYVLKLRKNFPKNTPKNLIEKSSNLGKGRYYVGMTGLHPNARYLNHLRGYKSSWFARKMAVAMVGFEGPMSHDDAVKREPEKAQELIQEGFDVDGGH